MYDRVKRRVFDIVQPSRDYDIASTAFDWSIIALISLNVLIVILDTFDGIPVSVRRLISYVEIFSLVLFSLEYILRFWTAGHLHPRANWLSAHLKYMFSFMALVDLFAILPFYLPYIFPVDLRVLRMFRLLRLLRLLKINRYTSALATVVSVLKRKSAQLLSSMLVVLILMVVSSILMYGIESEAQPEVFSNAFSGLWWATATLTTVGYGDIFPITSAGKVLGAIIALLGIGLVAVPTGIISAGFMENITHEPDEGKKKKHFCPFCGEDLGG